MNDLRAIIDQYVKSGADPNSIQEEVAETLSLALSEAFAPLGWELWGDGNWRLAAACSICGSCLPGICGHERNPNQTVLRGLDAIRKYKEVAEKPITRGTPCPS